MTISLVSPYARDAFAGEQSGLRRLLGDWGDGMSTFQDEAAKTLDRVNNIQDQFNEFGNKPPGNALFGAAQTTELMRHGNAQFDEKTIRFVNECDANGWTSAECKRFRQRGTMQQPKQYTQGPAAYNDGPAARALRLDIPGYRG